MPGDIASELEPTGVGPFGEFSMAGSPYDVPLSMDTPTADLQTPAVGTGGGTAADARMLGGSTGALPSGTSVTTATGAAPSSGILGTGVSWGDALRFGGPLAALGMLGYTAMRGPAPIPPAEQQALQNVSPGSPVYQVAQQYLKEAATGQLQPGEIAQIQQYQQNATNELFQQLANEGITDPSQDSRFVQGQQAIAQNAQIMYQKFITAAVTNGLAAQGNIDSTLQSAANMQAEADQNYQARLQAAASALAVTSTLSAYGTPRTV
jgi:hypothetical protein